MPRNIEIKARIDANINELIERIQPIADGPPRYFTQNDTFLIVYQVDDLNYGLNK